MKYSIVALFSLSFSLFAQDFPPSAGLPGSTAISSSSIYIDEWVSDVEVIRGPMNISEPDSGLASVGEAIDAEGPSDPAVVSLGDGGEAIITLSSPLANHGGFDFAIFENGFDANFLELAFVEVSSDGSNYFRFPSVSNTSTEVQIGPFNILDATYIHNLAGKYQSQYGTPFDLMDLDTIEGLDINQITHIKVIDVVGSIQEAFASYDSQGNIINDPWPTPFESSGFDLESVAILLENDLDLDELTNVLSYTYEDNVFALSDPSDRFEFKLFNFQGQLVKFGQSKSNISLQDLTNGVYIVHVLNEVHNFAAVKLLKN